MYILVKPRSHWGANNCDYWRVHRDHSRSQMFRDYFPRAAVFLNVKMVIVPSLDNLTCRLFKRYSASSLQGCLFFSVLFAWKVFDHFWKGNEKFHWIFRNLKSVQTFNKTQSIPFYSKFQIVLKCQNNWYLASGNQNIQRIKNYSEFLLIYSLTDFYLESVLH